MPKLSIRKCQEHSDCHLERVDGGEWAHTPSTRTVGERFALQEDLQKQIIDGLLQVEELRRMLRGIQRDSAKTAEESQKALPSLSTMENKLNKEIAKAIHLRRSLEKQESDADEWLTEVKAEAVHLPKTFDLQAKANQARAFLESKLRIVQEAGERLERAFQRADSQAAKLSGKMEELRALEARLLEAESRTNEKLAAAGERIAQVDSLLANLQGRKADLDRVGSVYEAVGQLTEELRTTIAEVLANDKETRRQIEHEREERLESVAKGIRSLQSHVEVSHA